MRALLENSARMEIQLMRKFTATWVTLLALCTLGFSSTPDTDKPIPFEWNDVERIVAIGDVHGAYDGLVSVLKQAGLVDKKLRWIGGNTHLVQMGDLVDRGPDSRKAMDLLEKLEKEAKKKGGHVHVLIGNHEVMNMVGLLDHTSEEEFDSFKGRNSRALRDRAFQRFYKDTVAAAKAQGLDKPSEKEERKKFEEAYPLGYFEHRVAFRPDGEYGRWILTHNVAIKINGIVFSHADWSERWAEVGIEEVNRRIRAELSGAADLEKGVTFAVDSPVQNRRFSRVALKRADQEAVEPELDRVLASLEATRIVVGHTMTRGGIEPRFGGKHLSVDAGMLDFYGGGQLVALEVKGETLRAIHSDGTLDLPEYLDESTQLDYLAAIAAVAPNNVVARIYLIDQYRVNRRPDEAWSTLESLLRNADSIPERFEQSVCNLYDKLASPEQTPAQWVTANCNH
jgi:hypothetical protein